MGSDLSTLEFGGNGASFLAIKGKTTAINEGFQQKADRAEVPFLQRGCLRGFWNC